MESLGHYRLALVLLTSLVILIDAKPGFFTNMVGGGEQADENDELDVMDVLAGFGEKLFSLPDNATGDAVSRWSPSSAHNPEELGAYPEGDILFPAPLARNGLRAKSARWPKGKVPYVIRGSFTKQDEDMIKLAIKEYHKNTCVRWIPRTTERDYVVITSGPTGCWSSVGRTGGAQELNLQTPGCVYKKGTVMHEMMHALGFLHEQNRWERDDYVVVNFQNIQPGRESNFDKAKKTDTDALGIAYDYGSVMHYSSTAFSVNGQPTIVPKKGSNIVLGQRDTVSKQDIQKIRRMYNCKKGH